MPAAASSSEPVHTDVVQVECSCAWRSQSSIGSSSISARVPKPPGTTITSGSGTSPSEWSATSASIPFSVRLDPGSFATKRTRAPGSAREHLIGPDRVKRREVVEDRDGDVHRHPG